jgi:XTP/dITP diphosphohydrolase
VTASVTWLRLGPWRGGLLLSRGGWSVLEAADLVLATSSSPWVGALAGDGIPVTVTTEGELTRYAGSAPSVVVLDEGNLDTRHAEALSAAVVDAVPSARGLGFLDLVQVMDRLRSPGGCPWDRAQTHASLVKHLLEEAGEAAEALTSGDRAHVVEELGDVLLQVVFNARVAQEASTEPFDIDDVAAGIVAKLTRRHPHVFAGVSAATPEEAMAVWQRAKADERAARPT